MTENSTDHMTGKYKVMITAGVARIILESVVKPQSDWEIDRVLYGCVSTKWVYMVSC